MAKKIIVFIRFFKEEAHRDAFLRGDLYMNRLRFFKAYEEQDACNIGDKHEGVTGWYQPDQISRMTIKNNVTGEEHVIKSLAGPVVLGLTRHNDYHVYCMSTLCTDDELTFETFDELKSHMMLDVEKGDLGDYCVVVAASEFIARLDIALKAEVQAGNIVGRGMVEYFDPDTFNGSFEEDQAILQKRECFSHQKEYRIYVYDGTSGHDSRVINVGDLSDIAHSFHKRDFYTTVLINQKDDGSASD